MSVKPATGEVTRHSDNKQNERGSGAANTPLKKSTTNADAAGMKKPTMAKPEKHGALPAGSRGVSDHAPSSGFEPRTSGKSTFRAPRSDGGHDPLTAGYTKPGKMK